MKAKYLFLSNIYSKFDIYCLHPEDKRKLETGELDRFELKRKRYKISFINGIYQTNDDREAEALMAHEHYGSNGLFILDKDTKLQNLKVEDKYGVDKDFADKLAKKKLHELKSIAHEKELASWAEIKRMTKEEIIRLMIRKKGLMTEYAA
ncbi:MAG: hypothetical protein ACP6IQ_10590 [Candidatus Njordarchaeia archaeon]